MLIVSFEKEENRAINSLELALEKTPVVGNSDHTPGTSCCLTFGRAGHVVFSVGGSARKCWPKGQVGML